ncbi:hypothetical protein Lepto7375DRAFT_7428 [Leptolyngbya sp. PCC 7375]|nr:hypothetical protein Lepto7375DRAFT_7428 [Leptolyngbya sp. PCC 7375]
MNKPETAVTPMETITTRSGRDLVTTIQRIKKEKPLHKIIIYAHDEPSPLWWWPN